MHGCARAPQLSRSVRLTETIPTGRALGAHHSQRRDRRETLLGLKAVLRFKPSVNSDRAPVRGCLEQRLVAFRRIFAGGASVSLRGVGVRNGGEMALRTRVRWGALSLVPRGNARTVGQSQISCGESPVEVSAPGAVDVIAPLRGPAPTRKTGPDQRVAK